MKKLINISTGITLLFSLLSAGNLFGQKQPLYTLVNPFIGTDGFGHTFPGATTPFGMVQLSPDTRTSGWENCSGYHSSNPTIIGFSHTHLSGTGASDYGDIMFMATDGVQLNAGDEKNPLTGYRSAFSKSTERASPGYYRVQLEDHKIQAEMSATTRCGMQKYTFQESENSVIITDLIHGISDKVTDASITIENDHAISGYRRSTGWAKDHIVYFYAEFSKPFNAYGLESSDGKKITGKTIQDLQGVKGWFKYATKKNESVLVKVGISTVSTANAKLNLTTEMPHWDFTKVIKDAAAVWEAELSRIVVEGGTKEDQVNFYTSLYHTMIAPNILSDVDGQYRGMDGKIHTMKNGPMYSVFSLWDTFRALHPLFTIIDTVRANEFVNALLQKYSESGLLPVWELASNETGCMIGYHSVPVITDAWFKNIRGYDANLAMEAMLKSGEQDHLGMKFYKNQGYIPADKENESVSKTLEYAYNDWCIASVGQSLNYDPTIVDTYRKRSKSYLNVYDIESGFMRGKKNSNWVKPFDPYEVSGIYTEANAWQYTWFAPHDIPGMISMMGGVSAFTGRLDTLFSTQAAITGRSQPDISGMIGQYAHGNEPSHHMIYLYQWSDKPYRTAALSRKIMKEFYTNKRDGLIGNEDCGQMSAWFVFSAMGFYPVCPGVPSYTIGSPLFDKITVNAHTKTPFVITADSSEKNIYVKQLLLNGKEFKSGKTGIPGGTGLQHQDIMKGGNLTFVLSGDIKELTGVPAPISPSSPVVMIPYLVSGEKSFYDSCKVALYTYTPQATIHYTIDGSVPTTKSAIYTNPIYITSTTILRMMATKAGFEASAVEESSFLKLPYKRDVYYTTKYSHLYTAGGDMGLIDGIYGEPNAFGSWQGFHGIDMNVTIDLHESRNISMIAASFLQQYPSWIWLPEEISFEISNDNKTFEPVYNYVNTIPKNKDGAFTENFRSDFPVRKARYIRVTAKNPAVCPPWHPGAGDKAWIFVDEITVQ
ncbi:MAG: GH92 family glycosyl hydrolase [Bacteroidetes bacterium]|nr:GH92 family glycosyl hydrolase [Bacteroidota bacterium]